MKRTVPLRTHTCGELGPESVGSSVILSGWIHKTRNLGSLVFFDIRDRWGLTQVVADLRFTPQEMYDKAKGLKLEDVVAVQGTVALRESPNALLKTGLIEIQVADIQVLSKAAVPPFSIPDDGTEVNEELRMKYRYLDMRKGKVLDNLVVRHKTMQSTRNFLSESGFIEVSTPILGKSTPEGARDYLVPSRVHHGHFYALPQSPQMFKQILMVGGLDRYFQIATCFRDEDLRADRQPEFQQIDIEMSFATHEELFPIIEGLVSTVFKEVKGVDIKKPFQRLTYAECMENYGSDKPDLRFGMPLIDASDLALRTDFQVFKDAVHAGGIVRGLTIQGGASMSRKEIDEYTKLVSQFGFKGLAWLKLQAEKNGDNESPSLRLQGPIAKFISLSEEAQWICRFGMKENDIILIVAGHKKRALQALDQLRRKLGRDLNLIQPDAYAPLWVTDFPLFAWNDEENRLESEHHPFTSPNFLDIDLIETAPLKVRSSSYDLVMNGYELASGSQRIHDGELQEKIFSTLGLSAKERQEKFGFFVEALQYGTPPHLGVALGFDRLVMILTGTDNIRDVIAFPKNQRAVDLMMAAPSTVTQHQLGELAIEIDADKKK